MNKKPVAVTGAVLVCDKGTTPAPLKASGVGTVKICDVFAATIIDVAPVTNISPFGMCLVTKAVCSPAPVGLWQNPLGNKCIFGNTESLLEGATLPCAIGGTISVKRASQTPAHVGDKHPPKEQPKKMSKEGIAKLMKNEDIKTKVYPDQGGKPTIGVGHLLTKGELASGKINIGGELVDYSKGITRQQALDLYGQDVARFERVVADKVKVPLTQNQFDALTSFSYNVGEGNFGESTVLRELNQGNYDAVPDAMKQWNKVNVNGVYVVSDGLISRRAHEVHLWNGD